MNKLSVAGVLLVVCTALLAACGSTSSATTSQMSTSTQHVGARFISPSSTSTQHVGARFISPSSTSAIPPNKRTLQAVGVQITLSDFHITPSLMTFMAGVPYHFTVTNQGKAVHELVLMSTTMKGMSMNDMPMKNMDQMTLASLKTMNPGAIKTLDYTFMLATAGHHPELSCHLPGHYETGMHLDLTVS